MRVTITDEKQAAAVWRAIGGEGPVPASLTVTSPERQVGRPCECGCGGTTGGGLWLPGHDAKRKSALFAMVRTGTKKEQTAALAEIAQRGWPSPAEPKAKAPKADTPKPATVADSTAERTAAREAAAAAV